MRSILGAVLAVVILCGCSGQPSTAPNEPAVRLVESLGGTVTRDDKQPGKPVIGVNLSGHGPHRDVSDADLKELKEFKHLTTLNLYECGNVTDDGVKELKELKQLTSLSLGHTKVTDAGLTELKELKQLTTLDLSHTQVTDAGLKELTELKQLTTLHLRNTKVTDGGVKELKEALPQCQINQ
jgi:hypothetical protein